MIGSNAFYHYHASIHLAQFRKSLLGQGGKIVFKLQKSLHEQQELNRIYGLGNKQTKKYMIRVASRSYSNSEINYLIKGMTGDILYGLGVFACYQEEDGVWAIRIATDDACSSGDEIKKMHKHAWKSSEDRLKLLHDEILRVREIFVQNAYSDEACMHDNGFNYGITEEFVVSGYKEGKTQLRNLKQQGYHTAKLVEDASTHQWSYEEIFMGKEVIEGTKIRLHKSEMLLAGTNIRDVEKLSYRSPAKQLRLRLS